MDISQEDLDELCKLVNFKPEDGKTVEDFWIHIEKFNEHLKVKY